MADRSAPRSERDWAELRARIEEAARATHESMVLAPEEARRVLAERARALAAAPVAARPERTLELVTFGLARGRYAVELRWVHEVFRLRQLTPLPGADAPIMGVTAWRGDVLTVVDLRPLVGAPVGALNDLSRVLVFGGARAAFGAVVDAVHDLVVVPRDALQAPPGGTRTDPALVLGVTTDALVVLDAERLVRRHSDDNLDTGH